MTKTILIVDDDNTARTFLRSFLESRNFEVLHCSNGKDALKTVIMRQPNLVLMDYRMPGLDGLNALDVMLTQFAKATPVIMVTGEKEEAFAINARKLGAVDVVTKPLDLLDLVTRIDAVLGTGAVAEQSAIRGANSLPVLLVEDQAVTRELTTLQLKRLGYVVHLANNGLEALEAVKARPYCAVLMDCVMPEMNGFEAARAIRQHEAASGGHVPIIAFSARLLEEEHAKWRNCGMDDFLKKPSSKEEIDCAIRRLISKRSPSNVIKPASIATRALTAKPSRSIDHGALNEIAEMQLEGQPDLVVNLINTFLGDLPSALKALNTAVDDGSPADLVSAAHGLKSASASIGAVKLSDYCSKLEDIGKVGSCKGARDVAMALMAESTEVTAELRAITAQRARSRTPTPMNELRVA